MKALSNNDTLMVFSREELNALQGILTEGAYAIQEILKSESEGANKYLPGQIEAFKKDFEIGKNILVQVQDRLCAISEREDIDREIWNAISRIL